MWRRSQTSQPEAKGKVYNAVCSRNVCVLYSEHGLNWKCCRHSPNICKCSCQLSFLISAHCFMCIACSLQSSMLRNVSFACICILYIFVKRLTAPFIAQAQIPLTMKTLGKDVVHVWFSMHFDWSPTSVCTKCWCAMRCLQLIWAFGHHNYADERWDACNWFGHFSCIWAS